MKKRFSMMISTMILVGVLSTWLLAKDHATVLLQYRILISIGGALLSGLITYFLANDKNEA